MTIIDTTRSRDANPRQDYNIAIKILHWVMAVGFGLMIATGFIMEYTEISKAQQFQLFQLHKSGGVILMFAFVLRIAARFGFARPPEIDGLSEFESRAAKTMHLALYLFMLAIPLTGWLMVSASIYGLPTIVFGFFEWPHIPNLQGNELIETFGRVVHTVLAWAFLGAIVLHVLAALKHQFVDKQNILARIVPSRGQP